MFGQIPDNADAIAKAVAASPRPEFYLLTLVLIGIFVLGFIAIRGMLGSLTKRDAAADEQTKALGAIRQSIESNTAALKTVCRGHAPAYQAPNHQP